jgi:hypothetical protein
MEHLIQITPNVLYSADVLSPEWGREYRQDRVTMRMAPIARSAQQPVTRVAPEEKGPARDAVTDQIALL